MGDIFDSPKGPLFVANVSELPLLKDKDTTGHRQKPALAQSQALLDVPPDERLDGIGNYRLLSAGCPRHGDLSVDEAQLLEAVSAFRETGRVRAVRLATLPSATSAQR